MRRPAAVSPAAVSAVVSTVLVLVALVSTAVVSTVLVGATRAQAASYTASGYAARLLSLVNDARQQHGLRPLSPAPGTAVVADAWTQHLASARSLSHNPALARDLARNGSSAWRTYGENVGVGNDDCPDELFRAYMHSPEHRDNILTAAYRYVGVAVVFTGSRAWNTFDFVDVYRPAQTASTHPTRHRRHPVVRHFASARAQARPAPQPAATGRPRHRPGPPSGHQALASRGFHHPVPRAVHVEAMQRQGRRPAHRLAPATDVAAISAWAADLPPSGPPTGSAGRGVAVAAALAVLALAAVARRWLLVVSGRVG